MVDGTITYMIVVARGRCWWRDRGIIVVIAIVIVSTIIVIVDIRINGYLWKVLPLVVITPRMILIIHYHLLCRIIIIHCRQQVLSIKWVHSPFTITTIICTTILVFTTTITTIIYSSIVTHTQITHFHHILKLTIHCIHIPELILHYLQVRVRCTKLTRHIFLQS